MNDLIRYSGDYFLAQSFASLLALYWFVVIFEIPRYLIAFFLVVFVPSRRQIQTRTDDYKVSVIVAGHNEEKSVERCVLSLHEQSRIPDEIILVSDGSNDKMSKKISDLLRRGLIHHAHGTELRAGKSAGANMASRWASGEIIINIDCDCSFDRDAIRNILKPFSDPEVVAVSGNILLRNAWKNLITRFQAIEYMVTISLGKQAMDRMNQVSCVSGAMGAFRSEVYHEIGGLDAGGGEDLDLTLRLRRKGGKIRFAPDAICFTDVPETVQHLLDQRFRWERDSVRLRYRKHIDMMNPFSRTFSLKELFHELEFLLFNVISAIALPFYLLWLFYTYGEFALVVILSAQLGLAVLDTLTFLLAAHLNPAQGSWRLMPYMFGFSVFNGYFMRFVRVSAYVQEWVFRASYFDAYVPPKVNQVRD